MINNKFTALNAKLVSDIDADVVKYTNESVALDNAYTGTQLYADFRLNKDYADNITNLQQLSDTEVEIISERSKYETMLKKIRNIINSHLLPKASSSVPKAPKVKPSKPPTTLSAYQTYNALYRTTYKTAPPAGHWATYQKTGVLKK